jgi:hypothetical protein
VVVLVGQLWLPVRLLVGLVPGLQLSGLNALLLKVARGLVPLLLSQLGLVCRGVK